MWSKRRSSCGRARTFRNYEAGRVMLLKRTFATLTIDKHAPRKFVRKLLWVIGCVAVHVYLN